MNKILVATDFSPKANRATEVGISLAEQFKAEIHFLHVFHTPVDWSKLPKGREQDFQEVKRKYSEAKSRLSEIEREAKEKGLETRSFISYDHENLNVVQHIDSHKHDLVVMGAHSKLGISDVLFGSMAVEVIDHSPVPILMVQETHHSQPLTSVMLGVDSEMNVFAQVQKTSKLFPSTKVSIKTFSVHTSSYKSSKKMLAGLNQLIRKKVSHNVSFEIVEAKSAEEGIIRKANSGDGQLLIIGSNRYNSVKDYLRSHVFPSISSKVLIPVLILK